MKHILLYIIFYFKYHLNLCINPNLNLWLPSQKKRKQENGLENLWHILQGQFKVAGIWTLFFGQKRGKKSTLQSKVKWKENQESPFKWHLASASVFQSLFKRLQSVLDGRAKWAMGGGWWVVSGIKKYLCIWGAAKFANWIRHTTCHTRLTKFRTILRATRPCNDAICPKKGVANTPTVYDIVCVCVFSGGG